jgi:hypothetical protein
MIQWSQQTVVISGAINTHIKQQVAKLCMGVSCGCLFKLAI